MHAYIETHTYTSMNLGGVDRYDYARSLKQHGIQTTKSRKENKEIQIISLCSL